MQMRRILLVGAIGLLTSCGLTTSASDDPTQAPTRTPTRTPTSSATFDVSCGEVVLAQGEVLEVAGSTQRACLEDALRDGRSATLAITAPTVEGDPIVTSWHLSDDGTLTAVIDSTQDRFAGEPRVTRSSCGRVTELPDLLTCEPSG